MRGDILKPTSIVLVLPPTVCTIAVHAAETKPNYVIIFADDLGYGDVGYQAGDVPTPNIDSIAENGVVMTDGYVTCPVCAPSRAGLLSGRYQQRFGFWDNIGPYPISKDVQPGIPTDVPIISERLKKLGYVCGLFGKTHEASPNKPLRGGKGSYWEGGLRVPFCIRWDGHIKPGQSYEHAVSSLDIMPTLTSAAVGKVESSWEMDDVDLLPYITAQKSGRPHDALYWAWGARKAIRVGDIKVVSINDGKTYEMFDLSIDISESNNIAGQRSPLHDYRYSWDVAA